VLILAGLAPAKTRAITFRMANLIANGSASRAILAVTFTKSRRGNAQSRFRTCCLRAGVPPAQPWLHVSFALRPPSAARGQLRPGLPRDFAITMTTIKLAAVKLP